MIQHYVEEIGENHHVRLLLTSNVIGPGRTKSGAAWELSVKALDANQYELGNQVTGKATPQYWEHQGNVVCHLKW